MGHATLHKYEIKERMRKRKGEGRKRANSLNELIIFFEKAVPSAGIHCGYLNINRLTDDFFFLLSFSLSHSHMICGKRYLTGLAARDQRHAFS